MHQAIYETLGKRALALVVAALLAMGAAFTLAGCSGASDEQVIRDGITKELDAFKNPTKEGLAPYIGEADEDQLAALEAYGIDIYEFIEHAFRGFDYEIGDITVDGDKAVANVKVTNIDVANVTQDVMAKISTDKDISAKVQKLSEGGDQAKIMEYVFSLIYEAMDAATDTVTTDTAINLTKTGNQWNVDEESITKMIQGMYGGLTS